MKNIIFWIGILLFAASCSPQKKLAEKKTRPVVKIAKQDSTKYELLTFDSKFETWYTTPCTTTRPLTARNPITSTGTGNMFQNGTTKPVTPLKIRFLSRL